MLHKLQKLNKILNLTLDVKMWYDKSAFPKRRGVNVKAKLSPIKGAVNLIGIILCIYFACSNIGVGKFDVDKEVASTANYIDVEQTEIKEDNKLDDIQIESE